MNKQSLIKNITGFVVLFVVASSLTSCSAKAEDRSENRGLTSASPSNTSRDTTVYIVPGKKEAEGMKTMMESESFKKIDEQWNHIHRARAYEKAGEYEQAEIEFKKAIETDKSDQGVPRRGLVRIYEASGQYQKALEQIDWLVQRTSRQNVLSDLLVQKQSLQKLLAEHKLYRTRSAGDTLDDF